MSNMNVAIGCQKNIENNVFIQSKYYVKYFISLTLVICLFVCGLVPSKLMI